jgi:hypothetical protein
MTNLIVILINTLFLKELKKKKKTCSISRRGVKFVGQVHSSLMIFIYEMKGPFFIILVGSAETHFFGEDLDRTSSMAVPPCMGSDVTFIIIIIF